MAQKVFKGFIQVTEAQFTGTPEDGYIYFVRTTSGESMEDGYVYFNGRKYGTAIDAVADIEDLIGEIPSGKSSVSEWITENERIVAESLTQLDGRVSANTENIAEVAASAHTHANKSVLDDITSEAVTSWDNAANSAHSHNNMEVLTGITSERVTAWDAAEDNAIAAASAYTDQKYDSAVTASAVVLSALTGESATTGFLKSYELFQGGTSLGKIDIPKDMVVSSGEVVTVSDVKYLRLYIANDPEHPVDIAVSDLAHVYTEGSGITITNDDKIEAKVVAQNGLSVDGDGIKLAVATTAQTGAMSSTDKEKLDTIATSAQTNVIEEIKVDGTALTVTDKAVDIVLSGYATNETVGTLSGRVDTLSGAVSANTEFITNSAATKEEVGTLSGRVDTLSAISADTRLDVLEASAATKTEVGTLSGRVDELELSAHTHNNKDVLDNITSADTEAWSAALQEVSGSTTVSVTAKSAAGVQTISVNVSVASGNTISVESDGLFAAIYYDGDDSE